VGPAALVHEIDKVRQPYNIPVSSQQGATYALRSLGAEIDRVVHVVVGERERLAAELRRLGFAVVDSSANFLWADAPKHGGELTAHLAARKVSVKSFHAAGGRLTNRLRITVGAPVENDRLLAELTRCL
jgi:histidinol-phosphate aminotransferase